MLLKYQLAAMLFSFGGYTWMAYRDGHWFAWLMAKGILNIIAAAYAQAGKVLSFTFTWYFYHNGVYHLIQMVGIVFIVAGLRKGMK